ncbi:MAG: VOC family protein [Actinobacteria bacterium]|nr:VOC family protein [Actinomycetota bacterium]
MQQRLSLVTLGVADIERSRRFYEALGWVGESPDGEVWFFQCGGMVVALWSRELLAADSGIHDSGIHDSGVNDSGVDDSGGWGGVTLAHNVTSPAEVDAILAEAGAAGATIARSGAPTEWGGYSGVFVDPDGHPWEVAHNPYWRIAADGSISLH